MHMSWRWRASLLGAAVTVAVMTASPAGAAGAAGDGQVAISLSGMFAQSTIYDAAFPDGTTREFSALLDRPGVVSATPPGSALDLSRPWATLSETMMSDPAGGYRDDGAAVCNAATNPTTTAPVPGTPSGSTVASFDVVCNDGAGYAFYRVQWALAPMSVNVTNPVTTLWMGDEMTSWSAGGLSGTVDLWPTASEITYGTVCGFRPATLTVPGHFDCYGRDGLNGYVAPSTNLMLAEDTASTNG